MKLIIYFLKLIYILCLKKKNFSKLKKKQIIIFDGVGSNFLKPLVKNYDYSILETRLSRIKQINLSLQLIKLMLKNFFKFNLINNYLVSSIEILSPSLVITFIDNNPNYHIASKYFFKRIKFFAIQNASRVDHSIENHLTPAKKKNFFHQELFHFGEYEKKIYKGLRVNKFTKVGSLRQCYAMEFFKKKKIKIKKNKYDIFLPSEAPLDYDNIHNIKGLEDGWGQVYNYTMRFCKKYKKKPALVSRYDYDDQSKENILLIKNEKNFYKKYLRDFKYKLLPRFANKYTSYKYILESKITIGTISSVLTEALAANKKILACNFTKFKKINFPVLKTSFNENSYEKFEKKLSLILNMNIKEYHKSLGKNKDLLIDSGSYSKNSFDIIQKNLKKILK